MNRRLKYSLVVIGIIAIVSFSAYDIYNALYGYTVTESFDLYVSHEDSYGTVRDRIHGSIDNHMAFDIYAAHLNLDERFKPGYYRIEDGESIISIVRRLCLGVQTPVMMEIACCRSTAQLAENVARYTDSSAESIETALRNPNVIDCREIGCDSLFAMFIPNTYEIMWSDSPETIVRRLAREADRFWNESRMEKLSKTGLSKAEATTLASIVNEESSRADDRRIIAGVYMNRLNRGMPLQACPTVIYALQDFSIRRVRRDQLRTDSPYNTYLHRGLPPTPICMPEISSIDAVLDYDHNSYLYFAADAEHPGKTVFSKSFGEHRRNGNKWKKKLNDLNIKK